VTSSGGTTCKRAGGATAEESATGGGVSVWPACADRHVTAANSGATHASTGVAPPLPTKLKARPREAVEWVTELAELMQGRAGA